MKKIVKQLRHGQITIPKELRDALNLQEDDLLSITLEEGKLEIEPVRTAPREQGSPWLKELYDLFAPVRQSLEGYSEQEIDDAIDAALKEVRSESRRRSKRR
jgi:AbrB family looped-hinge helix DNA binding protein